jgi:ferredoxin--NADP+ reductase
MKKFMEQTRDIAGLERLSYAPSLDQRPSSREVRVTTEMNYAKGTASVICYLIFKEELTLSEEEGDEQSNLDAMLAIAEQEKTSHARTMEFLFHHVPTEIKGSGRVQEVVFKTPSGKKVIKCGLVISAIGYEPQPHTGLSYEKGKVLNADGRVKENIYVVGWAKRGPSGVIGTNKSDAAAVIDLLIADLKSPKAAGDINDLIGAHKVITQTHWEAINNAEVSLGEPLGKPRVKVADKSELLRLGGL